MVKVKKELDDCFNKDNSLYCCKNCSYKSAIKRNFNAHLRNSHPAENKPAYHQINREKKLAYQKKYKAKKFEENPNYYKEEEEKRNSRPGIIKKRNERKRKTQLAISKMDRQSGASFNCDFPDCNFSATSRATLRSHKFSSHSETEKAKEWNLKHVGLAYYCKKNAKKFKPEESKPSDENFTTSTTRVQQLSKIFDEKWPSSYKDEHYLYFVAVVEKKAKKMGLFLYLDKYKKKETKTVKIYVGVSLDGCPSPYHTDPAKCYLSSIARACQPDSGMVAIHYRTIKVSKGKDHSENMALARTYESQYQISMQIRETVIPSPGLRFECLNRRMELTNMALLSKKERDSALYLGTTGIPPIILATQTDTSHQYICEDFCGGKSFQKVLNAKHKTCVMEFPKPLIPFRELDV